MGEIRFVGTGETRGYPYPVCKKNRIYHRATEKSQPEGKRMMPEARFTLTRRLKFLGLPRTPMIDYFSCQRTVVSIIIFFFHIFTIVYVYQPAPNVSRSFSLRRVSDVRKQRKLTSLLVCRVSCCSPWARHTFPAPLKIEQTLSRM